MLKNSSDSKVRVKTFKIRPDWTTQVLGRGSKLLRNEGNYFQMDTASHQKSLIFINTTMKTSDLPRFNWIWRTVHLLLLGNCLCSRQLCRAAFRHVRLADITNCTAASSGQTLYWLSGWQRSDLPDLAYCLIYDRRCHRSGLLTAARQGRQNSKTAIPWHVRPVLTN
jgi:hypothetical protein